MQMQILSSSMDKVSHKLNAYEIIHNTIAIYFITGDKKSVKISNFLSIIDANLYTGCHT